MKDGSERRALLKRARRLVVKVGSAVLTDRRGALNFRQVHHLADQVCALLAKGKEVIVVTSAAISAGIGELGLRRRPTTMPALQAAAAVGQSRLIRTYSEAFRRHGVGVGQVLLSREDMEDRARFLNTRNTLRALVAMGCVPVINENDSVCVEEIRYGDNDFLAAHLATAMMADLVVLLTTVDGLLGADGRSVVPVVERVSEEVLGLDDGGRSTVGTGGMASKLQAARMMTRAGVAVVVANGRRRNVLERIAAGEEVGTLFLPAARPMASRKRWIGFTARPRGQIVVDDGARKALVERGRSLLASGVRSVRGVFERGDVVAVVTESGVEFARGLTNYSSSEVERIKGCHTSQIAARLGRKDYDEVIHRDNLTLLE